MFPLYNNSVTIKIDNFRKFYKDSLQNIKNPSAFFTDGCIYLNIA